jgi:adenosylcobinamide-GDP ribazoletransferase
MNAREGTRGLVTALRTLSVLPVPGRDASSFSTALYWFPLAGLFLGSLQALCAFAVALSGWSELAGFAAVFSGILLTRALHADGLADLADGFFGGKNRESTLRIMKDPSVGSFGALSLVLVMLLKWIAAERLVGLQAYGSLVSGVMLARWVQVLLASTMPYARRKGGTAHSFVEGAGKRHLAISSISAAFLLFLLLRADMQQVLLLLAISGGVAAILGVLSFRKLTGVTGDVLGAVSELAETTVWVGCVLFFQ